MAARPAADVAVNDVIKCFAPDPRFEFEKKAGAGAWGRTLCFKVNHPQPGSGFECRSGDSLSKSKFILDWNSLLLVWLSSNGICANSVYNGQNTSSKFTILRQTLWQFRSVALTQRARFSECVRLSIREQGFNRPYLFTEYLENGTLFRFIQTFAAAHPGERLPNRFLWSIFLCLSRAAVAMAYPPGQRENSPPPNAAQRMLETVPAGRDSPDPERLMHNDMKNDNIMFGDIEMSILDVMADGPAAATEHVPIPILKLIDFGVAIEELPEERRAAPMGYAIDSYDGELGFIAMARDEEANMNIHNSPTNEAVNKNIIDIGAVMGRCLTLNNYFNPVRRYEIRKLVEDQRGADTRDPTLDLDLVTLIARCLALDQNNRPRLSRLLALCRDAAHSRTQAFYRGDARESDEYIAQLVQTLIFDA
ncbi:hypothetical protein F5Y18DRAFT_424371 [Xylariaceae sp. FL1019]|nr:hypothetical protein F5Y18DRAFT_424371 [Xylariaceae sp. FL1019]